MKSYNVKILDSADIDWSLIERAEIDQYAWGGDHRPESYAQLVYAATGDEREGVYAHLFSRENELTINYHRHNESVFLDSCLEFFFTMKMAGAPDNGYINIESNPNPTTLIAYGTDRYDRRFLVDMGITPFDVKSVINEDSWELYEFIPFTVIEKVFSVTKVDTTTEMRANFYKCGGDKGADSYGSWSPITTDAPDFHRPEAFGILKLV